MDGGPDVLVVSVPEEHGPPEAGAAYVLYGGVEHQGIYLAEARDVSLQVVEHLLQPDGAEVGHRLLVLVDDEGHLLVVGLQEGLALPGRLQLLLQQVLKFSIYLSFTHVHGELVDNVEVLGGLLVPGDDAVGEGRPEGVVLHLLVALRDPPPVYPEDAQKGLPGYPLVLLLLDPLLPTSE